MKNRKPRQIPSKIFGVSEAALFDKRAHKREIGLLADVIKVSRREKKSPLFAFEMCAQRQDLATLQKILEQGDAHESTRGKLLIAYKAAFAESDAYIGSLVDAVDLSQPPRSFSRDRTFLGWAFWGLMGPDVLASIIREHGLKPPTLARVREYFVRLYPECNANWPEGDVARDKVHRTTIVRMGLPLGKDRIGRPAKVKTSP
jgi:hypothetical protein